MNILEWVVNQSISLLYALWPQPKPGLDRLRNCRLVAHRGVHRETSDGVNPGPPLENSARSFELCVENQIWAAELDVRFTSDNEPLITHDPTAGRLWHRPDIIYSKCTFAEVRRELPEVLHLREVVERFALNSSPRLHLMIEIKENLSGQTARINKLKSVLTALKPEVDYHLLALNPLILEPLNFCPKSAYLDVIWLDSNTVIRANRELGHGAIAGHFLFFGQEKITELQKSGVKVAVGFLDSKNSLYREINRGVDFIFSNHPLRLKKILSEALDRPETT